MEDVYSEIVKSLTRSERVALATLVNRIGSAPRAVGAKYLVKEDGSSHGTIGGGCVEAEVWQGAQEIIKKGETGLLHFNLTAEQLAAGGLICGGTVDIFVEPLLPEFLEIYREVARIKKKGGAAVLATLVSLNGAPIKGAGAKALLTAAGDQIGKISAADELERHIRSESPDLIKENRPRMKTFNGDKGKLEVLLEPIVSEPTVYLFGAGHISQQVAPLAKKVAFKVVVIDDRDVFANPQRFPEADAVLVSDFEACFDKITVDESSYLIIVTRGHLYDGVVLEKAIQTHARYVGMIGSRNKIQTLYKNLIKKGISKNLLDSVHAPIGLDINSETPEEIGVSIVAELIQVRGENVH